jgi:hypothetical protein
MTTPEAYKTLDLAKGLGMDRVEVQFTKLKTEMESKMASTSNERLKQVYSTRLNQVEDAYTVLIEHFNSLETNVASEQQISSEKNNDKIPTKASNSWLKVVLFGSAVIGGVTIAFIIYTKIYASDSAQGETNPTEETSALQDTAELDEFTAIEEEQLNIFSTGEVREFLRNYYWENCYGEFNAYNFFADNVEQFISWKNTTPEKINEAHSSNNEFLEKEVYIRNESISPSGIIDRVQYFTFWIDFTCYRRSKDKYQRCQVQLEIGLNENKKMVSYKELKVTGLEFFDYYPEEVGD